MWPRPVAPRSSRRTASLWVVLALLSGCSPSADVVSADARGVVERILAAEPIQQWRFTYQGDNPSPYNACLQGEDVIIGTVDLDARLLWLQPDRRAPVVLVTDTEVLVPDLAGDDTWASVVWQADERTAATTNQFGNVLGRHVANGLGVADLNETVAALLEIADAVERVATPAQFDGDTIEITADPEAFSRQSGRAPDEPHADLARLTMTVVADPVGRVTAIIVDADTGPSGQVQPVTNTRYVMTASFDVEVPVAPEVGRRRPTDLEQLDYPQPADSCVFRP